MPDLKKRAKITSTGPRLLGRGDDPAVRPDGGHRDASTGPRLLGRGDPESLRQSGMDLIALQRGRAF